MLLKDTQLFTNRSLLSYLVGFFVVSNVVDMAGNIGIKYGSSFLLLFYILTQLRNIKLSLLEFSSLFVIVIFFPLYSVFIGIVNGAAPSSIFIPLPIFFSLPLIYFASKLMPGMRIINYLFTTLYYLAVLVLFLNIVALIAPNAFSYIGPFLKLIFANVDLYQGTRIDALVPKVYPRATLFFIPAGVYYLYTRRYFRFLIILSAVILAVSKSGILLLLGFFLLNMLGKFIFSYKLYILIFALIIISFITIKIYPNYFQIMVSMLTLQSETASLRILHLASLIDYFNTHPVSFVFGQGVGTSFFSQATHSMEMNIELDHFETIRRYGLIWGVVFYSLIIFVCVRAVLQRSSQIQLACGTSLFAGFLAAGTNPVLISPPFMILLVGVYCSSR
jgi:hypothetical protein